jgi:hypothetical protein
MNFALTMLLTLISVKVIAQTDISVLRYVEDPTRSDFSRDLASSNDSTFLILVGDYIHDDSIRYRVIKSNLQGNVIFQKNYNSSEPLFSLEIESFKTESYIYGIGNTVSNNNNLIERFFLHKIDSIGNTIYNNLYPFGLYYSNGFDIDSSGNIYIAGISPDPSDFQYTKYMKINPEGSVIYSDSILNDFDDPEHWRSDCTILSNQDLLISFNFTKYNTLGSDYQVELVLVDGDSGVVIWRKKTFLTDNHPVPITANPDGTFSYFGSLDTNSVDYIYGHFAYYTIDTLGNVINQSSFHYPNTGGDPYPSDIVRLSNGQHVCLTSQYFVVNNTMIPLGSAMLQFIHPDGSLNKIKLIAFWQGEEYFGSGDLNVTRITVLKDDKMLVGISAKLFLDTGSHYDPWVLLLDSTGCPFPNCPDTTILMGIIGDAGDLKETQLLRIAPNPVLDHCTISILEPLPADGIWRMYDSNGKILQQQEIPKLQSFSSDIDLTDLPSAMYYWNLALPDGQFWAGKLFKY